MKFNIDQLVMLLIFGGALFMGVPPMSLGFLMVMFCAGRRAHV
jgi:hypothetical protein